MNITETRKQDISYAPKIGHFVRTIQGMPVSGQVIRSTGNKVMFRSDNGKVYQTKLKNVQRNEKQNPLVEFVINSDEKDPHYRVYDTHTKSKSKRAYKSLASAYRSADKKSLAHGSYRYVPMVPHLNAKKVSEETIQETGDVGRRNRGLKNQWLRSHGSPTEPTSSKRDALLYAAEKKATKPVGKMSATERSERLKHLRGRKEFRDMMKRIEGTTRSNPMNNRRASSWGLGEEHLQELSPSTLQSYKSKATVDAMDIQKKGLEFKNYQDNMRRLGKHKLAGRVTHMLGSVIDRLYKRQRGIQRASARLTAEQNLDEISMGMTSRYWKAAHRDVGYHQQDSLEHGLYGNEKGLAKSQRKITKRRKGIQNAERRMGKRSPYVEQAIHELKDTTLGSYIRAAALRLSSGSYSKGKREGEGTPQNKISFRKEVKRMRGIDRASRKLAKEERLVELHKKTLASYIPKAAHDYGDLSHAAGDQKVDPFDKPKATVNTIRDYEPERMSAHDLFRRMEKRSKGIGMAAKKLAKEETLSELSKGLLTRYVDAATKSYGDNAIKSHVQAQWSRLHKQMSPERRAFEAGVKKADQKKTKRLKGIGVAIRKMAVGENIVAPDKYSDRINEVSDALLHKVRKLAGERAREHEDDAWEHETRGNSEKADRSIAKALKHGRKAALASKIIRDRRDRLEHDRASHEAEMKTRG